MKKFLVITSLCIAVFSAHAQTDSLLFSDKIKEHETSLINYVEKSGVWCCEQKKTNKYKRAKTYSGLECLVMYESKKPKSMYILSPINYFYFDLDLDGIIDGKYLDNTGGDIWKNVLHISTLPKHLLDSTASAHVDLSEIKDVERFQFYDLRDSVCTFYNTMRNEGEPEIIPIPKTGNINSLPGIQREILKYLEFESFGNK